jgi:hypothetical protein
LVYAYDINVLGVSVYTIKETTEALVVASKETGLELNADQTDYMVMTRDQNAGRSHSMNYENISFEMVKEFIHLATTLTNQNYMHVDNKSRL